MNYRKLNWTLVFAYRWLKRIHKFTQFRMLVENTGNTWKVKNSHICVRIVNPLSFITARKNLMHISTKIEDFASSSPCRNFSGFRRFFFFDFIIEFRFDVWSNFHRRRQFCKFMTNSVGNNVVLLKRRKLFGSRSLFGLHEKNCFKYGKRYLS